MNTFTPLTTIITGIYDLALTVGGILAFGAIIYGAARYTLAAGNPSGQHEGKESITQALLGLLLLFSAYLILHTINPDLTTIKLPELAKVEVKTTKYDPSDMSRCAAIQCRESPALQDLKSCVQDAKQPYSLVVGTSFAVASAVTSCHLGGRFCKSEGSHAIDYGFNALRAQGVAPQTMLAAVQGCGQKTGHTVQCRCENEGGSRFLDCSSSEATHIHCNVDVQHCGCN